MSKRINILYLHGFNSSPQSMKAELTKIYFFENFPSVSFFCPQLASSPEAIIEQLTSLIAAESDEESLW